MTTTTGDDDQKAKQTALDVRNIMLDVYKRQGTVMVHIRNLRTKIEADPQHPKRVCTVWGKGYRLVSEEQV